MTIGFDKPLSLLPFDHRGSFQTKLFGWEGTLAAAQTAEIAAAKQVVYDGFKAAIASGVPKEAAGILVDEQFGAAILRDAAGFIGFAVGRTTFRDPLVGWRAGTITRDAAVEEIARRYQEWVGIFEQVRVQA